MEKRVRVVIYFIFGNIMSDSKNNDFSKYRSRFGNGMFKGVLFGMNVEFK